MKTRRQYDEEFKKMAVDLSLAKGSLKTTAEELGITPQILTRWRRERLRSPTAQSSGANQVNTGQQEILRLRKELKQVELERDILKKAGAAPRSASSPGETGNISVHKSSSDYISR